MGTFISIAEARELKGKAEGKEEERMKSKQIVQALQAGLAASEQIAEYLGVTLADVLDWKETLGS